MTTTTASTQLAAAQAELEAIKVQKPVAYMVQFSPGARLVEITKEEFDNDVDGATVYRKQAFYTHPAPKQPWPDNCGSSHCSCIKCVAPLSPHHTAVMRQALEALEMADDYDTDGAKRRMSAITALKGEPKL